VSTDALLVLCERLKSTITGRGSNGLAVKSILECFEALEANPAEVAMIPASTMKILHEIEEVMAKVSPEPHNERTDRNMEFDTAFTRSTMGRKHVALGRTRMTMREKLSEDGKSLVPTNNDPKAKSSSSADATDHYRPNKWNGNDRNGGNRDGGDRSGGYRHSGGGGYKHHGGGGR
jgi:hypothetical protein